MDLPSALLGFFCLIVLPVYFVLSVVSDWRYSRITDTESAEPYMDRWIVTFVTGHQLRLHHILRSDRGRDFHDHPFTFLTLILWGGYWEIRPRQWLQKVTGERYPSTAVHYQWYGPGSCRKLPVDGVPHRVELQGGRTAWTLVWTWPKTKMWGFWLGKGEDARWIPHYRGRKGARVATLDTVPQ